MEKHTDNENDLIIDAYDYLGKAASATDCTGLIPFAPQSNSELQSYETLYHYRPSCKAKKMNNSDK